MFVEDPAIVLDKHGVGKAGLSRKRNEPRAEFLQKRFVGAVLFLSGGEIDELAVNEGKFAMNDGGADGARHGDKHGDRERLHEKATTTGNVEGNQNAE